MLFGATLLAIGKKDGGVRPIAVGFVWRRLAAKVAGRHITENCANIFSPRQLGVGIPGGAEPAVHATRIFLDNLQPGNILLKIDSQNAFNTVRRDVILEEIKEVFPELLPLADSTLARASDLIFGESLISSEEGAEQGDPLGSVYFCLAIRKLLMSLKSELVVAYLDTITLGGDAETVATDFDDLEKQARDLGLSLNRSKC